LWKSISTSEKVAVELPKALGWRLAEFGPLLYTWLVPHCDDFGRFHGSAHDVKGHVMPFSTQPVEAFEKVLIACDALGLVRLYQVNGRRYLCYPDWELRQTGLHKRTKSIFPEPPPFSRKFPEVPGSSEKTLHELKNKERLINPPYPPEGGGEVCFEFDWTAETAAAIEKETPKQWMAAWQKWHPKIVADAKGNPRDPVLVLATLLDVREGDEQPAKPWIAMSWIIKRLDEPRFPSQDHYDKAKELLRAAEK